MQSAPAPWPVPPSSPEAASPVRLWPELLRTAHLVYPEPTRHNKLNRLKYLLRGLLLAPSSLALLEILAAPKLRPLLAARPRVYSRLQWPYLDVRFRTESKLAALRAHHTFLLSTFPDSLLTAISSPEGFRLCSFELEELGSYTVLLKAGLFEKEGELSLSLFEHASHSPICSLSFTVNQWHPSPGELFIGGIQGHHFPDEKARTIAITRAMFGLRPKALLVFALQQLASHWNLHSIRAVSNERHIYRSLRKRREIQSDYDGFWTENGGSLDSDGNFLLPIVPEKKVIADLKPNKRTVYRKRYAWMESLSAEIRHALGPQTAEASLSTPPSQNE